MGSMVLSRDIQDFERLLIPTYNLTAYGRINSAICTLPVSYILHLLKKNEENFVSTVRFITALITI